MTDTDVRGDASLLETVDALELVLESYGLCRDPRRLMRMVEWLFEREFALERTRSSTAPTRLFIKAIRQTDSQRPATADTTKEPSDGR